MSDGPRTGGGPDDSTPPAGTPRATPQSDGPATAPWANTPAEQPAEAPRGRIRQQDGSTTPREPTLAEKRAREQKLRADREAVRLKEARSKTTKRVLIGAGATVGVVALIAAVYAGSGGGSESVEARCVDDQGVVVPDENCSGTQSQGQVSNGGGGFAFVPIFLGGNGRQYHYNYGGSGGVGQVATGGNISPPPGGTTVRSGTTGSTLGSATRSGTISRGGLGIGGSSGAGSTGGS
ncbi:hypothetical protein ACFU8R_04025 [Pseudonocardia alni]|uniref:hypothetical protein n=1 Tax=Pseudonocardia alni TaxID=33907 RepID=UPI00369EB020